MLPKFKRLTAHEVRTVLKEGKSARLGPISARYTIATQAKAAVVVSTKVTKKATDRNRLRRMGYRSLNLPARTHLVLFIHSKEASAADIAALCSKLSS